MMFSAVYLVCFVGEPCLTFVDKQTYPSLEICEVAAFNNIGHNNQVIREAGMPVPEVDYQCIRWTDA